MAMTCGTRSRPIASDFEYCVSDDYSVAFSDIDGTPPTSDSYSRYQWNLRMILENELYSTVLSDAPRDVKVAVIDLYPGHQNHVDLVNQYETGINLIEGGTNCNPPVWDGLPSTQSHAHGQAVASVIAAEHNGSGMAGVFHRARIIPVRASFDNLDLAIYQAQSAGAEVIHIAGWQPKQDMSTPDASYNDYCMWPDQFAPTTFPLRWMMKDVATGIYEKARMTAIRKAIEDVTWDCGTIISTVVANWSGLVSTVFPPSIHETIATCAVNYKGEPSPFNANNHYTTILAPGGDRREASVFHPTGWSATHPDMFGPNATCNPDDILTCIGPNKYSWGSGGSFAGPHTAAACAIIKSYLPDADAQTVRRLLVRSKQPIAFNLHILQGVGGMLSLKRLKALILAEI